jgi:hypothetical protein
LPTLIKWPGRIAGRPEQGCQIFLGPNIPKRENMYQMTTNYTRTAISILNGRKIFQMVIKYTNISIPRPSKITQSGVFGTKTQKPSGNPGAECGNSREKLFLAQIRNFVDCQCDQIGQNFDFLGKKT